MLPLFPSLVTGTQAQTLVPATPDRSVLIKVTPDRYEEIVKPGTPVMGVIDVFNIGTKPVRLHAELDEIRARADGSLEFLGTSEQRRFTSFVTVDTTSFRLAPGEAQRVPFRIDIPRAAWAGGHFGSISFSVEPRTDGAKRAVVQTARVGTLFILDTGDGPAPKAAIERLRVRGGTLDGTRTFDATFRNQGTTDAEPLGTAFRPIVRLTIDDMLGIRTATRRVKGNTLLPGVTAGERFKVDRRFWFGRYSATLQVDPGGDGATRTRTVHFWAFSWSAIILAILAIAAFAYGISVVRERRMRRWYDSYEAPDEDDDAASDAH